MPATRSAQSSFQYEHSASADYKLRRDIRLSSRSSWDSPRSRNTRTVVRPRLLPLVELSDYEMYALLDVAHKTASEQFACLRHPRWLAIPEAPRARELFRAHRAALKGRGPPLGCYEHQELVDLVRMAALTEQHYGREAGIDALVSAFDNIGVAPSTPKSRALLHASTRTCEERDMSELARAMDRLMNHDRPSYTPERRRTRYIAMQPWQEYEDHQLVQTLRDLTLEVDGDFPRPPSI